ncbi:phosphoribosyltransferase [Maribacter sp. ACAM166]|uniref:phosphoribosyltransferase n=1 Tax=Maribacter sp. ACAM166 TaxID=2508996 RepID=UPI0010FF3067|nr:phosphoribosyltransferase family protein [Maribacter sp. ACAM166]TLP81797.1 phosphoribosyltransferase [Maribacter sp. ACAM166]
MFEDRIDAGTQLAKKLLKFKNENVVVIAVPRGGLPIGALVAKALKAPLDVALTKKIGHPYHKEFAIGAASLEDIILTDAMGITQGYIEEEVARIRKKLRQRHDQYYRNNTPQKLTDKTVIIVDDGIATGNTLLATVELVSKQKPKKIIVAIPVAPNSGIHKFETNTNVNEIICLLVPQNFRAVGQFYRVFEQVSDQEAIAILEEFGG